MLFLYGKKKIGAGNAGWDIRYYLRVQIIIFKNSVDVLFVSIII